MAQRVQFGVRLPVAGPLASPGAITEVARTAERLGFDALWVHDFLVWTEHLDSAHISCGSHEAVEAARAYATYRPQFYESLTTLAFVAGTTARIRIGIAVLALPFRNPVQTAKQVATLDQLSGGRLILGVGVGTIKSSGNRDFEVLGVPRSDKYERAAEYLTAMQNIWTARYPEFHGTYVRFEKTELNPKPLQQPYPPIWLGGASDKAIQMAGRFGDGWLPGRLAASSYRAKIEEIRKIGLEHGRDLSGFVGGADIYACIAPTSSAAHADSRETIRVLTDAAGFRQFDAQQTFSEHALIGSSDEVASKIERYVEAGVSHFEMKYIYRDIDHLLAQLSQFSAEVRPRFL